MPVNGAEGRQDAEPEAWLEDAGEESLGGPLTMLLPYMHYMMYTYLCVIRIIPDVHDCNCVDIYTIIVYYTSIY